MGITGMMRTSVSGMNAQGNRLSAVADNVANASTAGYKRANVQFSTLVVPSGASSYESGGVNSHTRYEITKPGVARNTGLPGDVMINGPGFFQVSDDVNGNNKYLTRAGSFVIDKDGRLQNAAGFYLLGESGFPIQVEASGSGLKLAEQTTKITSAVNLRADAETVSGAIDPENPGTWNQKKSVTVYDPAGKPVSLDIYYAKTAENKWTMAVYEPAADPDSAPKQLISQELEFDKTGQLVSPAQDETIQLDLNEQIIDLNLWDAETPLLTQQGSEYMFRMEADGIPPGKFESFTFSPDGYVIISYSNGRQVIHPDKVGMATVSAPDRLTVISGTVFQENAETGALMFGDGAFGSLQTGVLEESNADIGNELTDMIEAQRNYTANSKVFQTGSEVMDVIVNLKR